jgi:DNA-binding response OmpR family regulator
MNTVLLVEDDTQTANLLKILFDIEGIGCVIPQDFLFDSIKLLIIKHKPDVILMDVNLKQNNGLTLLKNFQDNGLLDKKVKIIMTSGSDLRDECINAGADEFILKPYMPDELLTKVKEHKS